MTEIEINPEYASFREFGKIDMCCEWMLDYLFTTGHLRFNYIRYHKDAKSILKITGVKFFINKDDYFQMKYCPNCGVSIKINDRREDKMIESTDYNL